MDCSPLVETREDGSRHLDLAIEGITCAACIGDIERGLASLPGLDRARLNYTNRRLATEWRAADFAPAAIVARLTELGYKAHPFEASREEARDEADKGSIRMETLGAGESNASGAYREAV